MPKRMRWDTKRKRPKGIPADVVVMTEEALWAETRRSEVYSMLDDDFMFQLNDERVLNWFGESGYEIPYWLSEGRRSEHGALPEWPSSGYRYANELRQQLADKIWEYELQYYTIRFGMAPTDGMGPFGDLLKLENDDVIFLEIHRWTGEPEIELPEGYVTPDGETRYTGLEEFLYGRHYDGRVAKERLKELEGATDDDDIEEERRLKEIAAIAKEIVRVEDEERR